MTAHRSEGSQLSLAALIGAAAGLVAGAAASFLIYVSALPTPAGFTFGGARAASATPRSFAPMVMQVLPAVVSIEATQAPRALSRTLSGDPVVAEPEASGSGFFVSSDGHLVTNNHVISGADRIAVTHNDGWKLRARLIGRDPDTDLALLKVDGEKLPFASTRTARPAVGDWLVTIGSPFGLGGTATAGIVCAWNWDIGQPRTHRPTRRIAMNLDPPRAWQHNLRLDGGDAMSTEMLVLFGAMVLGLVHLAAASFTYKAQVGNAYSVGPRDADLPRLGVAGRLDRAQRNFLETFAIFASAVLMLELLGRAGTWLSEAGAMIYLGGRIFFLPLYAAGAPWLRTLSWNLATAGLAMVMTAVLWRP